MKKILVALTLSVFSAAGVAAPITLEGMNQIKSWTDFENQQGEMPGFIWGDSDVQGANRIGLYVEFANGLTGSATYDNVAGLWNTSNFAGVAAATATGFFNNAGGMHFLYNTDVTTNYPAALPIAWNGFVMDFSNNFDLDYNEFGNSNFRASVAGWQSVTITTYSSTARANDVPEPGTLALLGLSLAGLGWSRKRA